MPEIIPPSPAETEFPQALPVIYFERPRQRYWLHILLLLATCFTTLVVGARMQYDFQNNQPPFSFDSLFPLSWVLERPSRLFLGLPFASTLMLILLAHEMGHYLYCRYYGVDATLPFFIPFPNFFGTMGAFIKIRSQIRSRAALFDIGIAGPIAGFVVATIVLVFAMPVSKVLPPIAPDSSMQLGYPLIFRLVWHLLPVGQLKAHATSLNHVYFHPMAIAAWVGMFATALNLLPGGQLDGGHIVFAAAPRTHKFVSQLTILALIPMAFYFCYVWVIWAIVLRITSLRHPVVVEYPGITGVRLWFVPLAIAMLVLTFTPAPVAHSSLIQVWTDLKAGLG